MPRGARGEALEEYFEREWVRSLFSLAVEQLRADFVARNKAGQFQLFERYDLQDSGPAKRVQTPPPTP